jgi:DNA-binding GntR family transcriptional regulator
MPRADKGYTLVGRIYHDLLEQIMRGQTDATISENKLAKRFGSSKSPIRDALQRLASDGIVTPSPKRGWMIQVPNLKELRDLFVVSIVLEGFAAYHAAINATKTELEELARLAETDLIVDDLKSFREYAWKNYLFHVGIAAASHNPVLETHTRGVLSRIQLALVDADMWSEPDFMANGHQELVEHLIRRDPIGAQAAMEQQIRATMQRLLLPPVEFGRRWENPESLSHRENERRYS